MDLLKNVLKLINFIEYMLAAYQLFVVKSIDLGLFLTILSVVLTGVIVLCEKKDILIDNLRKKYDEVTLYKKALRYSGKISIGFIIIESICMALLVFYDKIFFEKYDINCGVMVLFITFYIIIPIVYVLGTKIIMSLSENKYNIAKINSYVVFFPSLMICIYLKLFNSSILALWYMFVISLPSLCCSRVIKKNSK